MDENACPFCNADTTGIVLPCARTVSGRGLSRATLLALVAAGVELTDCTFSQDEYGSPVAFMPDSGLQSTGGRVFNTGGARSTGGVSVGGTGATTGGRSSSGGTAGSAGRTGTQTDGATDAPPDSGSDVSTDSAIDGGTPRDVSGPTDATSKDQSSG